MISDQLWEFDRALRKSIEPGLARKLARELDEGIVSYEGLFPPPGQTWPEIDYLRKLIRDYLREETEENFLTLWEEAERALWYHDVGCETHKLVVDPDGKIVFDRFGRMQFEPLTEGSVEIREHATSPLNTENGERNVES